MFILKLNAGRVRRMKERLLQQKKFDETGTEENEDKTMKVNSFINKWIAKGEISIALLEIAKER